MNLLKVPDNFRVEDRSMRFMVYTLFALIVADGLVTQFLVTDGRAAEMNPFLQAWVGKDMFLAIKVSGAFLVSLLLWLKYNAMPKRIFRITASFLTIYTAIVFWNLFVLIIT